MHVFCNRCVKMQVVNEKTREKLARCAECKNSFSHRNLRQNKKFDNILEIFRGFRTDNPTLCTQIPARFPIFNAEEAKQRMLDQATNQVVRQQHIVIPPPSLTVQLLEQKQQQTSNRRAGNKRKLPPQNNNNNCNSDNSKDEREGEKT